MTLTYGIVDVFFYTLMVVALIGVIIFMCIDIANSIKLSNLQSQIKKLDKDYIDFVKEIKSQDLLNAVALLSSACLYRISLIKEDEKIYNIEKTIMTKAWKEIRMKLINELRWEIESTTPDFHPDIYEAIQRIIHLIQTNELTPKMK